MDESVTMVIGAAEDCDLRVNDPYASAHHAAVTRRPNGTYWVADLGSTNGTYVGPTFIGKARVYGPTPTPGRRHHLGGPYADSVGSSHLIGTG